MLQFEYLDNSYAVTGQVEPLETDIIIPSTYDDGVNGEHPVTEVGGFISSGIDSVVFSNNIKVIRGQAFSLNNLTDVSIPDSVTSIRYNAFYSNQLTSVTIPESVTSIGGSAFANNYIEFVNIPQSLVLQDGIEPIKASVFSNNNLKKVQWNSNASILSYTFNGADNKIEEFIITYDGMIQAPFEDSFSWDAMTKPMKVLVKNQGLIDDYRNTMNINYQWKNWEIEGKIIFDIIDENLDFRKLGSIYVNPNSTKIREIKFLPEQEIESLKTNAVESEVDTLYVSNETELSFEIIDNLLSESTADVLSANQGRVLKGLIDGKQTGKVYSDIEDMVNDLNIATDYKQALNLFIVDLNVPDFWISSVEETSVPYTYTTDEELINAVKISPVQIGLYKISALETAKVDLTNYVSKDEVINNLTSSDTNKPLAANQGRILNETKVDKVEGKNLSTNDYANTDKSKVDKLITNGDGTKYLSDDGEYKTLDLDIEDSLTSVATDKALSANQGRVLNEKVENIKLKFIVEEGF